MSSASLEHAHTLREQAMTLLGTGAVAEAMAALQAAAIEFAVVQAVPEQADTLARLARIAWGCADQDQAAAMWYGQAESLYNTLGDQASQIGVLEELASLRFYQQQYGEVDSLAQKGCDLAEARGNLVEQASMLNYQGMAAFEQGNLARAEAMFLRAAATSKRAGDRKRMASNAAALGRVAWREGRHEHGEAMLRRALRDLEDAEDPPQAAVVKYFLAACLREAGRADEAHQLEAEVRYTLGDHVDWRQFGQGGSRPRGEP